MSYSQLAAGEAYCHYVLGERMPHLRIKSTGGDRAISFAAGPTLREILDGIPVYVGSVCGGMGVCGGCRVRIVEGIPNPPTVNEHTLLTPDLIARGTRLACQVRPRGDLHIRVDAAAPSPSWHPLTKHEYSPVVSRSNCGPWQASVRPVGVAIDVGTTHLRVAAWDMRNARRIAARTSINPQGTFGADVLSRLTAADASSVCAQEMGRLIRDTIGSTLSDIVPQELGGLAGIGRVAIVGNTAMLALLTGSGYRALLDPVYWTTEICCQPDDTTSWRRWWPIPADAVVEVAQPLGGFVGSDLLACVLAARLMEGPTAALLVDFGTNSEIALWDGDTLWATSAAGGPAFEGCGISSGMPSERGAIFRAQLTDSTPKFAIQVIGGGEPRGLCGSGLVDVIACLLRAGILDARGRLSFPPRRHGIPLLPNESGLQLTCEDVDAFQRAKAAISAGILCLMGAAGVAAQDLRRVCVCGAFGKFLDVRNARDTGLLPPVASHIIELVGSAALAGVEVLLFDPDSGGTLMALRRRARLLNMAQFPEFENRYFDSLFIRPMADVSLLRGAP